MKFSFVLPAYKGRYLRDSIESILRQDYQDFELIVVDDCSPDSLQEIVSSFQDSRVSYYRNEQNIGGKNLVAQWNHCLSYAKGEYVILATDDDLYEKNFLSSFVPLIEKYPFADLFRARVLVVDSENKIKEIDRCFKEHLTEAEFRYHMMHAIRGGIPQYIFRREALNAKGGFIDFPLAWGSDDATAMMMSQHGVINSQEHLVRFRYSDINISSDQKRTAIPKLKARLQLAQWMEDHKLVVSQTGDWTLFYKREVIDFLPTHIKQLLIVRLTAIPWNQWPAALHLIMESDVLPKADKLSVLYYAMKKKL